MKRMMVMGIVMSVVFASAVYAQTEQTTETVPQAMGRNHEMQKSLAEVVQTSGAGEEILEVQSFTHETEAKALCELFLLRIVRLTRCLSG